MDIERGGRWTLRGEVGGHSRGEVGHIERGGRWTH